MRAHVFSTRIRVLRMSLSLRAVTWGGGRNGLLGEARSHEKKNSFSVKFSAVPFSCSLEYLFSKQQSE
jgi:hypothetical protein